jgi:hypothetical protein
MASERTVLRIMGRALWDTTRPTTTDLQARQLAVALGYPESWRVVRHIETNHEASKQMESSVSEQPLSTKSTKTIIVDRIYAGLPGTGCDMWFHHTAAMQVAALWGGIIGQEDENTVDNNTPFDQKGGHLLPREPQFDKNDLVQVLYEEEWWDAKILRRKDDDDTYRYQVQYGFDHSKQSGVEEELIKPRDLVKDPATTALELGLGQGWEAVESGGKRWKITDPEGVSYKSKTAALKAYKLVVSTEKEMEGGDPPWRTVGSEYLGRRVVWTTKHAASARRTVDVDQIGTLTGYISETDVDQSGEPGFVSEKTGKPAKLYHVAFDDEPSHPYASYLVQSQDLEEDELLECMVPEDNSAKSPAKKKARKR